MLRLTLHSVQWAHWLGRSHHHHWRNRHACLNGTCAHGRTGWGELIVIIREIVMLARMALALTTRACHGGDDGIVVHGVGHRGEVRRVGARAITGAARGTMRGHLACAQGH